MNLSKSLHNAGEFAQQNDFPVAEIGDFLSEVSR